MKTQRALPTFILLLIVAMVPVSASDADAAARTLDTEREIQPSSLGSWKEVIDSTLFLLVRKTGISRGPVRVMVSASENIRCSFYQDGTFVVTSALIDWIDRTLYEKAGASSRMIRSFDSEREQMLVPFLAPEIAHFALGHSSQAVRTAGEKLDADRFAVILVALAGYDRTILESFLSSLSLAQTKGTIDPSIKLYLDSYPPVAERLAAITNTEPNLARIADVLGSILDSLEAGYALKEASESLDDLAEIYPDSPYIERLQAIACHERWLATVPESTSVLPVFLPLASDIKSSRDGYLALANKKLTSASPFPAAPAIAPTSSIPGDASLFERAASAYVKALRGVADPAFESAAARLLAYASREGKSGIEHALSISASAAEREAGSSSFIARANYACLLFLTAKDYVKSQNEMDKLSSTDTPSPDERFLEEGTPGDKRDIILAQALILATLGDTSRARLKLNDAAVLFAKKANPDPIDFRKVRIGDSVDDLAEKWGKPSSISFNTYIEIWRYPSLSASVVIQNKNIVNIQFGLNSPLSPGYEIRCGDTRSDFEKYFGNPTYRAGDCDIYMKDGNRLSVFFLAGKIRSISAGL
jgi:hypothetical protein